MFLVRIALCVVCCLVVAVALVAPATIQNKAHTPNVRQHKPDKTNASHHNADKTHASNRNEDKILPSHDNSSPETPPLISHLPSTSKDGNTKVSKWKDDKAAEDMSDEQTDEEEKYVPPKLNEAKSILQDDVQSIKGDSTSMNDSMVAFSAVAMGVVNYVAGNPVIFDQTITNEGGRYFNTTGQFACTDDEVYVFTCAMAASSNESVPGMRVLTALHRGTEEVKLGPKVIRYGVFRGGSSEMGALVQCRTSPITAITMVIQPWSETNPVVILSPYYPGISAFKLGDPTDIIGFMAELSAGTDKFPQDTLVFDTVLQNYGDHYSGLTGMFTCPDDGLYVFMVSAQSTEPDKWSVSSLMLGEDEILQGPLTYKATAEDDGGSDTVTTALRCQFSKQIYVRARKTDDFQYNSYGARLTSFMGFRLYPASAPDAVAFTVVLDHNVTNPAPGTRLMYSKVVTNEGGAYNAFSGSFVCPDDKLYMFSFTVVVSSSVHTAVYMDSSRVRSLYTPGPLSGSRTASVIIRCQPSSNVYVEHEDINDRTYLAEHNSFSGYRLPGQG